MKSRTVLILAALVTPPDVITQVILFTVVYGLYEISIFLVRRVETKREAKLREEGYYDDEDEEDPEHKFPHSFVFAGSHLRDKGSGPREYLSDLSGNVISISTFGFFSTNASAISSGAIKQLSGNPLAIPLAMTMISGSTP